MDAWSTLAGHTVLYGAWPSARTASAWPSASWDKHKATKIWDLDSGKEAFSLATIGVVCVAFSPDGRRLATGSDGGSVEVWDLDTGKEALSFDGHTNEVSSSGAFSHPDGRRVAAASWDNTVKVWDLGHGQGGPQLRRAHGLGTGRGF